MPPKQTVLQRKLVAQKKRQNAKQRASRLLAYRMGRDVQGLQQFAAPNWTSTSPWCTTPARGICQMRCYGDKKAPDLLLMHCCKVIVHITSPPFHMRAPKFQFPIHRECLENWTLQTCPQCKEEFQPWQYNIFVPAQVQPPPSTPHCTVSHSGPGSTQG